MRLLTSLRQDQVSVLTSLRQDDVSVLTSLRQDQGDAVYVVVRRSQRHGPRGAGFVESSGVGVCPVHRVV